MPFTEADTRANLIDPQLQRAGRKTDYITREWYFTDGRKLVGGKRGERCFADYVLKYNGVNLAIIEAKSEEKEPSAGLEQVKRYGEMLHIRFLYATNGHKIYEFDLQEGRGDFIENYPTPEQLYQRIINPNANIEQEILAVPYHYDGRRPRYYQDIAIRKAISAIASDQERILLTLATGTGKTYISFQIVWKLFQASRSRNKETKRRPRVLFLADRNVLVDQAMNDYNPLENDCIKITGAEIRKRHGKVPTNANIFFAIYQAIVAGDDGNSPEDELGGYFTDYPSDFFDLVIIDECHRGGANESGNWHQILEHFSPAVHLGMTATPKREDNIDTYRYFGDPIYEYSLKDGINDGFLSPYKVKRIRTNIDELVIDSTVQVIEGEIEKDLYELQDFDTKIIVPQRTDLICQDLLSQIKPNEKTIIFCVDQNHALRVRDGINKYKTNKDPDYCVRVTSDEGIIGRTYLERFQDNDKTIPTILTSSQMLTTGVDAKNVRNIVLLRNIGSMVEFKQIIGRGTRLFEGKDFFTIVDYTGATNLFYDPEWDGETLDEPIDTPEPPTPPVTPPEPPTGPEDPPPPPPPRPPRPVVKLTDGRELKITNVETRYIDEHGKPMSATDYLESLIGKLPRLYQSEEQLRELRANPDTREQLLHELTALGIDSEQLHSLQSMFDAEECDIYDVLAHLSFSAEFKKRTERVVRVKDHKIVFDDAPTIEAKQFLEFLLSYYEDHGSEELLRGKIGSLIKLYDHGTVLDMSKAFGGNEKLIQAWYGMQKELFNI